MSQRQLIPLRSRKIGETKRYIATGDCATLGGQSVRESSDEPANDKPAQVIQYFGAQ
jgi:hypothetical protein